MIENRELSIDDYLAMLRRRLKVILIPALLAPLAGLMVSYIFAPKYTSQALILVERQKVPESMVQPVVSEDLTARIQTLQQQVLSRSELQPIVERLQLSRTPEGVDGAIDNIRLNMTGEPVPDLSQIGGAIKKKPGQGGPVPGFYLSYTDSNPREAQSICNELTSSMIRDHGKAIDQAASGTSDVLSRGLEDAKSHLDDLDAKVAAFKKQYVGQLPGDQENNLKILMGLNSQLDANTQTLNRAQQDKAYTESMLAQQLAAWNSSQSSTNPQTLEKQLSELQTVLLGLQARYTDDHPDVIKTKADIAEVKKKLAEINKATSDAGAGASSTQAASAMEPPEIRQFRLQVHQYSDLITAATRDQKRLEQEIAGYQGKIALSPNVEEQYKGLTRDYENAQKNYQDLLAKKSSADLTVNMNNQSEGERMFALNAANLPDTPDFPNRLLFAAGGLGAGLALGCGLALWLELRDNSIRTEADAEAALELPLLVAVPWVGAVDEDEKNGKFGFWNRNKSPDEHKETIGA